MAVLSRRPQIVACSIDPCFPSILVIDPADRRTALQSLEDRYAPPASIEGDAYVVLTGGATLQRLALGVPEQAILVDDRSRTTQENARYTKELLVQHGLASSINHFRFSPGKVSQTF
ncbi:MULTISPECIES: ElyC/SanA/YdcF family protein [unclassified Paenibacillus]|uniref:ElyC/SanA/YdcF family protein n=1 Tax=unclassified Paenibacillus TaxID=185978 RepID=UPI001B67A832|nr:MULTISPECIES: ElyC/SanA/YdcF family protein [unclassified Paenibacillus]MBP1156799.1 uncharacterized SAM-binding protein YcdF (DUF218 family) [Paenibacillus sp. PvP091]MBP1172462.1 uncharacterized SAM-binding protein YcdF (DUF218 family) [Paenibacillus sp. PvR098]MBP2438843.1 uncharacterized SAM-binding protein YcdF (DUF218 family) [Paenibacillus sp. PvP052]